MITFTHAKKLALADLLKNIVYNDKNYDTRASLIIKAMAQAIECGYKVGLRVDWLSHWPVCIIHLPGNNQISWHMKPDGHKYDDHTTEEKFMRIDQYIKALA